MFWNRRKFVVTHPDATEPFVIKAKSRQKAEKKLKSIIQARITPIFAFSYDISKVNRIFEEFKIIECKSEYKRQFFIEKGLKDADCNIDNMEIVVENLVDAGWRPSK